MILDFSQIPMNIDLWEKKPTIFRHQNNKVFYKHIKNHDSKPTILFIHGFMGSSYEFYHLFDALANDFNLVAADMLGFGLSEKREDYHYSVLDYAEIQASLCHILALDKVHLVAHDFGAMVANQMLINHDELVKTKRTIHFNIESVLFLAGEITPSERHFSIKERFMAGVLSQTLLPFIYSKSWFTEQFNAKTAQPIAEQDLNTLWKLASKQEGSKVFKKLSQLFKEYTFNGITRKNIRANTLPKHLLYGTQDPSIADKQLQRYKDLMTNLSINQIEGVGHYPHLEKPTETARYIKTFIEQQEKEQTQSI